MRVLLVDNHDSYTYNLFQLLARTCGDEPVVAANDDAAWSMLNLGGFDCAVISPGPGHPGTARDFGRCPDLLACSNLPVLGVCLGHQGIGVVAGADIVPAPRPRHGHLTTVHHTGTGLFEGIPQGFTAVRYHSLCVAEPLPATLEATARAEDGVIMGFAHRQRPWWGVQFHPESVSTEHGARLVSNFRDLVLGSGHRSTFVTARAPCARPSAPSRASAAKTVPAPPLHAHVVTIDGAADTASVFAALYRESRQSSWLDSAHVEPGLSRFSFLGDATAPGDEVLRYRVGDGSVVVERTGRARMLEPGSIFDALERRLGRAVHGASALPFDLAGGYVGYFGYELKAELGGRVAHRSEAPDALWLRASRFIAVDHLRDRTYVVAVVEDRDLPNARAWACATVARVWPRCFRARDIGGCDEPPAPGTDTSGLLVRSRQQYLADIAVCQRKLREGESYEICLTNALIAQAPADDLEYYLRLRRCNPAPYSAFFRFDELTVCCSSPERFLKIDRSRRVESRPIKGTAPRSADPDLDERLRTSLRHDPKTRAENLMIVDLLRNDLGRVSEIGSVTVPRFLTVESYATVHQLVSTVRGTLRDGVSTIDCVRACFPGGSMTGAPKIRTMEIIDDLETRARGIYSGALGYVGFSGTADLNIVIRTAVRWRNELAIGAGGAIVLGSDPAAEYDEMRLKAKAPLRALSAYGRQMATPPGAPHR